jgi:puromycin-sensitive aminopeptidase
MGPEPRGGLSTVPVDARLPDHVHPVRYEPHVHVSLDEDTFSGLIVAELLVEQTCERFQLHASELEPEQAHVVVEPEGEARQLDVEIEAVPEAERWLVHLPERVEPGAIELEIAYEGQLGEDMTGLYRSQAGEKTCLVTQCEPADARAIFPCLDEPAFKAEIAWRVRAPAGLRVLANGPLRDLEGHGDQTATRIFEPVGPISTYLAAIAVGDFAASEELTRRGVPFQVWALEGADELGERARDQAARAMLWFEDYFDQPYPYAKYDQVAVPSFSFGAMENVGLVVFRESLLLVDRDRATWDETKAVDRVVAHELAHMWFGNLTTMAWWDDLWLNEAFAEWIAHRVVDELEPDHEIWHAFRARTDQALATDALDSTHAIYHPVETPAEAMEMFDAITYGKGSAVMRMLAAYLGEEAFQQGLRSYIEAFREDNATGQQLWDHLAKASEEPVAAVMRAWITQPGHPCVEVELVDEDPARIELAQHRHRARRSSTLQDPRWPVPVVLRYADHAGVHEHRVLLEKSSRTIELDVEGELAWCLANADQVGFYRVDHGDELEARLIDRVRELSPAERWGLLRDSFSLVKAGTREPEDHLALLEELATGQAHFAFVDDVVGHVRQLERWLEAHGDEEALEGLRAWTRSTFGLALDEVGLDPVGGEDPSRRHRRASVWAAVAGIGHEPEAVRRAEHVATREREDPNGLEPEQATAAVRIAARHGDHERFQAHVDTYLDRREDGAAPQQVERYLRSLPLFRDSDSVDALLDLVDEGRIPAQNVGPVLEGLLSQPHAQGATLAYVEGNLDELQRRLGISWIARVGEALGHVGVEHREQAVELLEDELVERVPEAAERALERLEQTRELAEAGVPEAIADWARRHA